MLQVMQEVTGVTIHPNGWRTGTGVVNERSFLILADLGALETLWARTDVRGITPTFYIPWDRGGPSTDQKGLIRRYMENRAAHVFYVDTKREGFLGWDA